jgi:hypothetical protein
VFVPSHWQLRSIVGVLEGHVYYPGGQANLHLMKLNTATNEVEIARILTFSPRCLAAKNGWVCCGGETGEFVAVQVDGGAENAVMDADARLPIDLDGGRQDDYSMLPLLGRSRANKPAIAESERFGKERVNCITMWFPPTSTAAYDGAYQQPVAVLANNDKHVIVVDLSSQQALDNLECGDCVNRALLSPDGRLLIAICDDPYLYVYDRSPKTREVSTSHRSAENPGHEWLRIAKVHLKGQRVNDHSDRRGSFAACFSTNGKYLAVGTQYGMISIFRTESFLEREDALVTCFASSRPETSEGAVREMAFCPGPFDLLAWSEDRGTVGVADLRSNFFSRQTLHIDDEDAYEHVDTSELAPVVDPRLLAASHDRSDPSSNLASSLDISSDGRRPSRTSSYLLDRLERNHPMDELRNLTRQTQAQTQAALNANRDLLARTEATLESSREALDRYQYPLRPDETQVLEALQEHRRRRELREQQRERTREQQRNSIQDYISTRLPYTYRAGSRAAGTADDTRTRERSASVSRAVNDLLGNIQSQRERLRETQREERARIRATAEAERRRSPALALGSSLQRPTTTGARSTADAFATDGPNAASGLSNANERMQRMWASPLSGSGWDSLEELYRISFEPGGTSDSDRIAALGNLVAQREQTLMGDGDDPLAHIRLRAYGSGPVQSDETAGLAWSEDGRRL